MILLKQSTRALALLAGFLVIGGQSIAAQTVKAAPPIPALRPGEEIVVIETEGFGKVKIQLFADVAPKHVANFKKLIRQGFYNGLAFHRAVPDLIVQGGDPTTKGDDRMLWGMGDDSLPRVNAEFNDRPFVKGTLGAARARDPNSASSQFFLCASGYPDWNGQYTNFGQVISGLEVVQQMTMVPTDAQQRVQTKIVMKRVYLEKYRRPIKKPTAKVRKAGRSVAKK